MTKPFIVLCMAFMASLCFAQTNILIRAVAPTSRLDSIIIPEIAFREADIREVIKFLCDASRKYDKSALPEERRGVNIVLMDMSNNSKLTLAMRNVSLRSVLEVVAEASGLSVNPQGEVILLRKLPSRNGGATGPQRSK